MLFLAVCVCVCVGAVHLARFGYNPQSECPFVRSSRKSWNCAGTSNCDLVPGKAHFRFIFKHLRLKCLLCQCPERQGAEEAWQAVQNHHKRQEMRKQIAKQEEQKLLAYAPGWRGVGGGGGGGTPPMLSKWIFKLVCRLELEVGGRSRCPLGKWTRTSTSLAVTFWCLFKWIKWFLKC